MTDTANRKRPKSIDDRVAEIVAEAPPLSTGQRIRLKQIFGPVSAPDRQTAGAR